MAVIFKEEGHIYESLDSNLDKESIKWLSVTSLVSMFHPKFNAKAQAKKSAKNKRSKWYNMSEKDILAAWKGESNRALGLGNWYHGQREKDILEFETIERHGAEIPIIRPIEDGKGIKIASDQKLLDGVYPEHLVYLKSAGLCGQADLVEVVNNKIHITDYKTNKEIKSKGFTNWEGVTSKMFNPINHLDDCNLNYYTLQLSLYAYIIKKHNPKLKIGNLIIQHVKFKQEGKNEYGYPINEFIDGEPVVDDIKMHKLSYLKDEVKNIIEWLSKNPVK
tara:strand:- start:3406 stop:4236 length:831 start_codon:yes stop_codon:yes gene_type:complete